jgi:thymidylate synthase
MTNDERYEKLIAKLKKRPLLSNGTREIVDYHGKWDPVEKISATNWNYAQAEIDWFLTMDRCIKGHDYIGSNAVWKRIATDDGIINSNYGWAIFSEQNGKQFENAVKQLEHDSLSRHGVMIYTRPSMHKEYCDGINAKYDFMCNMIVQCLIRRDRLEYIVTLRSNDAVLGFKNNFAWHQFVYQRVWERLCTTYPGLKAGSIHWNAASMHLYEDNEGNRKSSEVLQLKRDKAGFKTAAQPMKPGIGVVVGAWDL